MRTLRQSIHSKRLKFWILHKLNTPLDNELAAIEAGDRCEAFKKYLPVLIKLRDPINCKLGAWRIAAVNNYNSLDGEVYLAVAILSALVLGEKDFKETRKQLERIKEAIELSGIDSDRFVEDVRKIEVELPPLPRQSGKEWPRKVFIYLTSLALYKLDHERHDREAMELWNATGILPEITDKKTVTNIMDRINLEAIADSKTANLSTIISPTPDPKS